MGNGLRPRSRFSYVDASPPQGDSATLAKPTRMLRALEALPDEPQALDFGATV